MGYRNGVSRRGEKGQALIEMALVLLLLFVVVFGITEFGRYLFYWNTFNNAARAGVRQAVVLPDLVTDDPNITGTSCVTCVKKILADSLSSANITATTVTVTIYDKATGAPKSPAQNGDRVEVKVSWTFNILTGSLIPFFSGSRPIVGDASMRYEL
jgi:Flp pilus assembly protein TadG